MSREDTRHWERRLKEAPDDAEALLRLVVARRRAGLPVPARDLERVVFPGRSFSSEQKLQVFATLPSGEERCVGHTPGRVAIPEHRRFHVEPWRFPPVAEIASELRAQDVSGVALGGKREPASALAALEDVSWLRLVRWNLADEGLAHVAGLPLSSLSLEECRNVDLAPLAGMQGLSELEIVGCGRVTDGALRHLKGLPELARVKLDQLSVGPRGVEWLVELPALRALELRRLASFAHAPVERMKRLERLVIEAPHDTLDDQLAELPELVSLEAQLARLTDAALDAIVSRKRLRSLRLSVSTRRDDLATRAAALPLEELGLPTAALAAQDVSAIASMPSLRALDLSHAFVTTSLEPLAALASLRELSLTNIGLAELGFVEKLASLEKLDLTGVPLDEEELDRLPRSLVELRLAGWTQLGDAGLAALARLPRLRKLVVSQAKRVTERGYERLEKADALEELVVWLAAPVAKRALAAVQKKRPQLRVFLETNVAPWVSIHGTRIL